jgi:histidinol-phosphate/aromatic aminotransferase/cobyric acid decarboxylase-like protein
VSFPLSEWIDSHSSVRHNLARSGMGPALDTVARALATASRLAPDRGRLTAELARAVGVASDRLFLTHGATEGNTLVTFFLARRRRARTARPPRLRTPVPEYPPLRDTASWAGYVLARRPGGCDLTILSDPNNPTGHRWTDAEFARWRDGSTDVLVDETFREFTSAPSRARAGRTGVWTTGTFTKAYGADPIRVGFVVAPPDAAREFRDFHGLVLDDLPAASVQAARALLRRRTAILTETRSVFERNRRQLAEATPDGAAIAAPVWFDRLPRAADGDRLARALLRRGVLVCPGRFFGDPAGVRLCLTQRSFAEDFAAYLEERRRWG